MDASDFTFIENHLKVVLPAAFAHFMRQFPNDRSHRLDNSCGVIPTNAELFVIAQLQTFNKDGGFDYYELQPLLRERKFMDIGGDGCGNFYCMVGNDRDSHELWIWEHDPYNGLSRCDNSILDDYLDAHWRLVTQPDPFLQTPLDGSVISRANHPHRSILAPITMKEWRDYVNRNPSLELAESDQVTNPFTKETMITFPRHWAGRARMLVADRLAHILYVGGRLMLSSQHSITEEHTRVMQKIAVDLRANLF